MIPPSHMSCCASSMAEAHSMGEISCFGGEGAFRVALSFLYCAIGTRSCSVAQTLCTGHITSKSQTQGLKLKPLDYI